MTNFGIGKHNIAGARSFNHKIGVKKDEQNPLISQKEALKEEPSAGITDGFSASDKSSKTVNLTILHTNDVHGNILPRKSKKNEAMGIKSKVGGEAQIATRIRQERQEAAEKGEPLLLLDAGDMAMGTPISGMFEGKPVIEIMNSEGYDAATVGNHDLDWGVGPLKNMIQEASFPFLAANMQESDGKPFAAVKPFIIKDLPGVKVGIVGIASPETGEISSQDEVKAMKFQDPSSTLRATIPEMKRRGAEMIIVLSHAGLEEDKKLAQNVKGIDLIVGGHSHNTLDKPVQVGKSLIVQTGYGGKNLGKVNLTWDPDSKEVVAGTGEIIRITTDDINPDTAIQSIVQKYQKKVDAIMNVPLGEAKEYFDQPAHGEETNLGNTITDIMRKKSGADIALLNSGSIRTDLPSGTVKYKDIYSVIPFDSKLVTVRLKGSDIMEILERSAEETHDKTLQVSGLSMVYDSSRPKGKKLMSVSMPDGSVLDPEKDYSVATIDYLAKGGDQYHAFVKGQFGADYGVLREEFASEVKAHGGISAAIAGRVSDLKENVGF